MIIHHISGGSLILISLVLEGRCMVLSLLHLLAELSNPFVNLHWLLSQTKTPKNSWIVIINAFGLTFTFLGARVLPIPLLIYKSYFCLMKQLTLSPGYFYLNILLVLLTTIQHSLNIYWGYKVARGFLKFVKLKKD